MDFKRTYSIFSKLIVCFLILSKSLAADLNLLKFRLNDLRTGKLTDLKMYQGQPVIITFFQAQCASCLEQKTAFECVEKKHLGKLRILYLGVFSTEKELAKELKMKKIDYPAYEASLSYIKTVGGVSYTPYTLITNAQGEFVTKVQGVLACDKLDQLLKDKSLW